MQQKTITVNRALTELKTLTSRIAKDESRGVFISSVNTKATKIGGKTLDEYTEELKSAFQSLNDKFTLRDALKKAIIMSNANTTIVVDGKTLTIAEAIYEKDIIEEKVSLLGTYRSQLLKHNMTIASNEKDLESGFQKYIIAMFGGNDKVETEVVQSHREQYYETNGKKMIDPNGLGEYIKAEAAKLEAFNDNIDALITESNCRTELTINW